MKLPKLTRRRFLALAGGSAALLAADALALEPNWIKTRTVRLAAGPPTRRIVQFTDTHHKGDRAYLARAIAQINALAPDYVFFTGDIIEEAKFLPEALELFQGLKAPLYGVPGNHDYLSNADFTVIARAFAAARGQWLLNENVLLDGGKINLIGAVCDRPDLIHPLPGVKNILLMHYPAWVKRLAGKQFDLLLAGHSHGGQVRIPWLGAPVVPYSVRPYDLGLYQTPSGPLYVNPGLGYLFVDVRLNCRPEITVFEV